MLKKYYLGGFFWAPILLKWYQNMSGFACVRVALVPCCAYKCVPTAISSGVDISEVPGCQLLWQMSSQWGSQKISQIQGLVSHEFTAYLSVFWPFLTELIMVILSEGCKPDNFESRNSLKLSFLNIRVLCSNFVECESFFESNLEDSIDCGNFAVRGYFFNSKGFYYSYAWSFSLCERKTSFLHRTYL